MAITAAFSGLELMCFGIAVRTVFLDELVLRVVREHSIATVLSVGCGLDARPWRLGLPPELRWMEFDLPAMIEYKSSVLAGETPPVRLERMVADVTDPEQRAKIFAAAEGPTLMITEGLLMYLPAESVEALAVEAKQAGVGHWLMDATSQTFARRVHMDSYQSIENVRAEGHLNGEEIIELVGRLGWKSVARRSYAVDVPARIPQVRLQELMASMPQRPDPPPPMTDDPSGVHLFGA